MANNRIIITGEKETFIVRVLMKKVEDAGVACRFVPCTVDDINEALDDTLLVVLYMDDNIRPQEDVLRFIRDSLDEKGGRMILIGEHTDIAFVYDNVPGEFITRTFTRPVNNDEFVECIKDFFKKVDSGDFMKSILVVDDDPSYLGLVRQWLKGTYKVSMANSGLQAIKWLGKNKVDLILLDYEMPITTGPQVLEMLRADDETKSIPVMFLTGKGDKESVMAVVALRPEGYFLKSIEREELLQKLKEYFTLHK